MSAGADSGDTPFRYNLELTPGQLKVTHAALAAALDGAETDSEVAELLSGVLAKLPDSAQIDSIRWSRATPDTTPENEDEPPPPVVA